MFGRCQHHREENPPPLSPALGCSRCPTEALQESEGNLCAPYPAPSYHNPSVFAPSQFWSRTKGHFVCIQHMCGDLQCLSGRTDPCCCAYCCHLECCLGPDSWGGWEVAGPQMKSQPSFDHQLAEDRLRAPRGDMNPGDSLPPHCTPCSIVEFFTDTLGR